MLLWSSFPQPYAKHQCMFHAYLLEQNDGKHIQSNGSHDDLSTIFFIPLEQLCLYFMTPYLFLSKVTVYGWKKRFIYVKLSISVMSWLFVCFF